jgi:glycerol-3-phosphate dehydrogenase
MKTDVLIIGGGVTGNAIARELSKYEVDVILTEKEPDVGWGQTKAGYALCHPGARWAPGSLAQSMIAEANRMFDGLLDELEVELKRPGELILAFDADEMAALSTIKERGLNIGLKGLEIIDRQKIQILEPNVNPAAIAALYLPMAGIFNPFELVYAFYENAKANGVRILLNSEVFKIIKEDNSFVVETNKDEICARYVVNAAGLYAETVSEMVGVNNFKLTYDTKATCFVVDKSLGDVITRIITGLIEPCAYTRFKLATPTYSGNILIYTPLREPARDINDRSVAEKKLDQTVKSVKSLLPDVKFEDHVITAFSGLAARNDREDFIIEASPGYPRFINVAVPPPGITCCPAIAKRVVSILKEVGLRLIEKSGFNPHRPAIKSPKNVSEEALKSLIKENPYYGKVVCRCEEVTEGEIRDAVLRGATTLDGVKFRTRAGMGRCQGNFCGPHLTNLLSKVLDCSFDRISKMGPGSPYVISPQLDKRQ